MVSGFYPPAWIAIGIQDGANLIDAAELTDKTGCRFWPGALTICAAG
jgi:hypothetical protein